MSAWISLLMTDAFDEAQYVSGGFPVAYGGVAADSYGEPLEAAVYIRDSDGSLIVPTREATAAWLGGETVLSISQITRRRDIDFGVVQGSVVQVQLTNNNAWFQNYDLGGLWCAVYGRFDSEGTEAIMVQGKIMRVSYTSDYKIMLEVHDSMLDVLNYSLPRDIRFQESGWLSSMKQDEVDGKASAFPDENMISLDPASLVDETFVVEFMSSTVFKVILEDGDESQTGVILADRTIQGVAGVDVVTLELAGWDTGTGAYVTGDRYVFYTAAARTQQTLTPVYMVRHLLDTVMGATGFDVYSGSVIPTVAHDAVQWSTKQAAFSDYAIYGVNGSFKKGDKISALIVDLLKIVHGSIYPSQNGMIALWVLDNSSEFSVELNGNPADGQVDIASARSDTDMRTLVNDVSFKYISLESGNDASCPAVDADTAWPETRSKEIETKWECRGPAISSAANIYINRFKAGIQRYYLDTVLAGSVAEIGKQVRFSDDTVGAVAVQSDIVEIGVGLIENTAQIVSYVDPVVLTEYAKVDIDTTDGPKVVW